MSFSTIKSQIPYPVELVEVIYLRINPTEVNATYSELTYLQHSTVNNFTISSTNRIVVHFISQHLKMLGSCQVDFQRQTTSFIITFPRSLGVSLLNFPCAFENLLLQVRILTGESLCQKVLFLAQAHV